MRDMFDEILKFGSYIVDNLREYRQPIFIYLPPFGELRGGAWVVLDPTINPEAMEMYSDPRARGGVLEPAGTVEIKYRQRDLIKTMHRLDPKLKELRDSMERKDPPVTLHEGSEIQAKITARERELMESYQVSRMIFFSPLCSTSSFVKSNKHFHFLIGSCDWFRRSS
jgi:acetyl-CoA carboxylase/biotin carboxylase 1